MYSINSAARGETIYDNRLKESWGSGSARPNLQETEIQNNLMCRKNTSALVLPSMIATLSDGYDTLLVGNICTERARAVSFASSACWFLHLSLLQGRFLRVETMEGLLYIFLPFDHPP